MYRIRCYRNKNIVNEYEDHCEEERVGELILDSDMLTANLIANQLSYFKGINKVEVEEIK